MRHYSLMDHFLSGADRLIRMLSGNVMANNHSREIPGKQLPEADLTSQEQKHIAGLMRVNFAGEVCAQALYQGQALTARNHEIRQKLEQAGLEEEDHLLWCQSRINELDSRVSILNPLWYAGSFLLGVTAGIIGDHWNLGFLEETEKQVVKHLDDHLQQLPESDEKTKTILSKMREEEAQHAVVANEAGASELPFVIKKAMQFTSKIMTTTAYRI